MSRPAPPRRGDDAGVASVWAATAAAVLLLVGIVGVDLAAATRARHVASAAADLAARNGAELLTCSLDGWDALVETRVAWSGLLPLRGPARARARAGPAPVDTGPPPASGTVDGSGPTAEPS